MLAIFHIYNQQYERILSTLNIWYIARKHFVITKAMNSLHELLWNVVCPDRNHADSECGCEMGSFDTDMSFINCIVRARNGNGVELLITGEWSASNVAAVTIQSKNLRMSYNNNMFRNTLRLFIAEYYSCERFIANRLIPKIRMLERFTLIVSDTGKLDQPQTLYAYNTTNDKLWIYNWANIPLSFCIRQKNLLVCWMRTNMRSHSH